MTRLLAFVLLMASPVAAEVSYLTACSGVEISEPDDGILRLDIRNREPDYSRTCVFGTEHGEVVLRQTVTMNGGGGCCDDRYEVMNAPDGFMAFPEALDIPERATDTIIIRRYNGF